MSEVAPNQDRIEPTVKPRPAPASGSGANQAGVIAAGVLLSRIAGLVRDSIFAHFLGDSATADAFKAGFRIPNILQNLFGEGVLSASFIPVYGKLLGEGDDETADMLAWGVGAIMTLGVTVLVAIGVLVTPYLIDVIAPGFEGDKRDLTIQIVRILFPGAGLLVMSAWFLGVLNSHHKFFVSYTAPVAWNVAMIAALLYYGPRRSQDGLAIAISWGSVVGSALQIAVQVPQTLALLEEASHRLRAHRRAAAIGLSQPDAGGHQPRRHQSQHLHRQHPREPVADRRCRRAQLRAVALHGADQPVRIFGGRVGIARDVARGRCDARADERDPAHATQSRIAPDRVHGRCPRPRPS